MSHNIIPSLLYTDLYKLTMLKAVYYNFPEAIAKYSFKCRNDIDLLPYKDKIKEQVVLCDSLIFKLDELVYLSNLSYFDDNFIGFLSNYKLNSNQVFITEKDNKLNIEIEGPWWATILWEIYLLVIVHEVYTSTKYDKEENRIHYGEGVKRLNDKIKPLLEMDNKPFIVEFGTRRAYNSYWLEYVIRTLWDKKVIKGTSNVYYGMKYNIPIFGTHAHEFICAGQALVHPLDSQKYMLDVWMKTYPNGELAIALSDSLGIDKFIKDFDYKLASQYKGIRQDSGKPKEVCDKIYQHYRELGIDPKSKTIMFSDSLDIPKVIDLQKYCDNVINCSFGVGTNFSNDCGVEPLQNVIKLVELNGRPVAKLDDSSGKEMCQDNTYMNYLKEIL